MQSLALLQHPLAMRKEIGRLWSPYSAAASRQNLPFLVFVGLIPCFSHRASAPQAATRLSSAAAFCCFWLHLRAFPRPDSAGATTRRCRNNSSHGAKHLSLEHQVSAFIDWRLSSADPEFWHACNPCLAACATRRVLSPLGQSPCPKRHRNVSRTTLGALMSMETDVSSTFRIPCPCGREPPRRPIVDPRPVSPSPRRRADFRGTRSGFAARRGSRGVFVGPLTMGPPCCPWRNRTEARPRGWPASGRNRLNGRNVFPPCAYRRGRDSAPRRAAAPRP